MNINYEINADKNTTTIKLNTEHGRFTAEYQGVEHDIEVLHQTAIYDSAKSLPEIIEPVEPDAPNNHYAEFVITKDGWKILRYIDIGKEQNKSLGWRIRK